MCHNMEAANSTRHRSGKNITHVNTGFQQTLLHRSPHSWMVRKVHFIKATSRARNMYERIVKRRWSENPINFQQGDFIDPIRWHWSECMFQFRGVRHFTSCDVMMAYWPLLTGLQSRQAVAILCHGSTDIFLVTALFTLHFNVHLTMLTRCVSCCGIFVYCAWFCTFVSCCAQVLFPFLPGFLHVNSLACRTLWLAVRTSF